LSGWQAFEVVTQGNSISAISDVGYGTTATRGLYDGLGALLSQDKLFIQVNHETTSNAAISRVDVTVADLKQGIASRIDGGVTPFPASFVTGMGYAYDQIFDSTYHAINNPLPVATGTTAVGTYGVTNFQRFCSGTSYLPNEFGPGRGFVDPLYLTGEETFTSGGEFFALDPTTRTLWEVPDVGTASWENAALVDTGNTTHVALMMNADNNSPGSPIRLYVGQKNIDANGDLLIDTLERNGLRGGSVYYFRPDAGFSTTDLPSGQVTGTWGTSLTGALTEDKLEDIHTNPLNGSQVVFSDQTDGVYVTNLNLQFAGNSLDLANSAATITQIDAPGVEAAGIGAPDNLVWSADGKIYVQEDGDGNDIWHLNPDGTGLTKIADAFSEPSGIFDVSALVGYQAGSVFLTSIQGTGAAGAQLSVFISPTAAAVPDSADFDGDGDVDGRDFLIWQRSVGQPAQVDFAVGDANHDARVDAGDLAIWQAQFGTGPGPLSAVPEPSTLALCCSAVVLLLSRQRAKISAAQ
jgi:hypothetical protein